MTADTDNDSDNDSEKIKEYRDRDDCVVHIDQTGRYEVTRDGETVVSGTLDEPRQGGA